MIYNVNAKIRSFNLRCSLSARAYEVTTLTEETFNTTSTKKEITTTRLISETTVLTIDDFIQINLVEFAKLFKLKLTKRGYFGNGMWYVDKNNTNYLLVPTTVNDLQKAVNNASDGDTICVGGFCKTKEEVERDIANANARAAKTFLPSQTASFAVMVSAFIAIGVTGISGKYSSNYVFTHI